MHQLLNIAKHWAIEPDYLNLIASQCALLNAQSNKKHKPARTSHHDDIAVIPIHGPITQQESILSSLLETTSLNRFKSEFEDALYDEDINAVLLHIDSPGGIAIGPSDMAKLIYESRNCKPIWAYIAGHGCSAAYWLAVGAEKVIANPSALVGSIGVVTAISVQETPDSEGYRHIEIVSSHAQHKRPDPRTADGMKQIRKELDALETEFINDIAKYRNTPIDKIASDFGQGGVLIGREAKTLGMVDEVSTFEQALEALGSIGLPQEQCSHNNHHSNHSNLIGETPMSHVTTQPAAETSIPTTQLLAISESMIQAQHPSVYEAIKQVGIEAGLAQAASDIKSAVAQGMKAGREAENERLKSIESVSMPGYEELVANAKADFNMTGEKLALQILALEKAKGNHFIQAASKAESELPDITPNLEPATNPNKVAPDAPLSEKAKAKWNSDAKIRAEFTSLEVFEAYCQASQNGQARILGYKEGGLV